MTSVSPSRHTFQLVCSTAIYETNMDSFYVRASSPLGFSLAY